MSNHIDYLVKIVPTLKADVEVIDIITKDEQIAQKDPDLEKLLDIYGQQLVYFKEKYPDSYFVAAYDPNGVYLGGVFLFLREGAPGVNPNPPVFQAIAKSIAGLKDPVKLNSLLLPAIVRFLKAEGYSEVRVEPYENQQRILEKHYGFILGHFGEMTLKF